MIYPYYEADLAAVHSKGLVCFFTQVFCPHPSPLPEGEGKRALTLALSQRERGKEPSP